MVHIQDLSLAFGRQVLFERLDLTLLPNEWVCLLGCSGVGKSTLLRLIAGLEAQGKVQGNIIFHPNIRVTWLPQKDTLYPWLSIIDNVQLENVLFGNKSAKTTLQAKALLEQVGMSEHLHKSCAQLSGGQKQRVAIARALVGKPTILLCDEATSALDPNTTTQIIDLLRSLQKKLKLTVVMITHQMEVVKSICNKVAVMEEGEIVEEGSLVEVFSDPHSSITKEFREKTLYRKEAVKLAEKNQRNLYELTFIGEKANDPAIMDLVRKFPVEVSILFGNIEILSGTPFGTLTVDIKGKAQDIEEALRYLRGRDIRVEALGVLGKTDASEGAEKPDDADSERGEGTLGETEREGKEDGNGVVE